MSSEEIPLPRKFSDLLSFLRKSKSAVLAFSGGVDSSFLLKAMDMSGMRLLAVTAVSKTIPGKDALRAEAFARSAGVEHLVIRTEELRNEAFAGNPPDRCFHCKDELFRKLRVIAEEGGYGSIFDGSNADDLLDYRPGRKAAALHGVMSPLAECGFSKKEIRRMSRELGLSSWDQPSSPCLSSRFPYGRRITPEALARVEAAEAFITTFGPRDLRVRDHGDVARIEVNEEDIDILTRPENRRLITGKLRSLGYEFISLDLSGYRSGSMNRVLRMQNVKCKMQNEDNK